jgi:hypothetical protein
MTIITKLLTIPMGFHLSQTQGRSAKGKKHTRGLHANQCGLKNGTLMECYKKVENIIQSFITPKT